MTAENTIKELIRQAENTRYLITEILEAYLPETDDIEIHVKRRRDTET